MREFVKKIINSFGYSVLKSSTLRKYKEKLDPFITQKELINKREDIRIFDVGAHYGETAIKYANVFPRADIYSFEPFFESAKRFSENTHLYSNIKLYEHAFSNKIGQSEFYINSSDATNSLLNSAITNSWIDSATKNENSLKVKVDTVDNFCAQNSIDKIDILKLDVQGGELLVLEGAKTMLSGKIGMVFMEVEFVEIYKGQPLFNNVTDFLERLNYKLFGIYDINYLENGQIAWCDALYIRVK